jgi:hypothetical protein
MEDNNNYTYTYRKSKKKDQQRRLVILAAAFCVLLAVVILFGALFGNRAAVKKYEKEQAEAASIAAEQTTEAPEVTEDNEPYKLGEYTVSTGGYSLKFRDSHDTDGKVYLEIAENTKLEITEIYHDEAAAADGKGIEYWGKTTYKGYTGWVAMNYMKKAYSDSIVTPENLPTTTEPATEPPATEPVTQKPTEPATQKPAENTTAPAEATTAAPETTAAPKFATGEYIVNTGEYTLTFRDKPSKSGTPILSIKSGEHVMVTAVVESSDPDKGSWGEITYLGHKGYVSMDYLKKAS